MTEPHAEDTMEGEVGPDRKLLPTDREGITHKVEIGNFTGYLTANRQADGSLGELFIHGFGSTGSTMEGMINAFAIMASIGFQFGAELPMLARKFAHMRFEPNGETDNPHIPYCHSIPDYIFRWLAFHFGDKSLKKELALIDLEMARG
jgi:ribonucleoside-diphosphate reductase alpha chain